MEIGSELESQRKVFASKWKLTDRKSLPRLSRQNGGWNFLSNAKTRLENGNAANKR